MGNTTEDRRAKLQKHVATLRLTDMERTVLEWLLQSNDNGSLYGHESNDSYLSCQPYSDKAIIATLRRLEKKGYVSYVFETTEVIRHYSYRLLPELATDGAKKSNDERSKWRITR